MKDSKSHPSISYLDLRGFRPHKFGCHLFFFITSIYMKKYIFFFSRNASSTMKFDIIGK